MAGLWEQIWLWDVPFGVVAFLTLVLFIASLCVLGHGVKNTKAQKLIEVGVLDFVLLMAFLVFILFLYFAEIIARGTKTDGGKEMRLCIILNIVQSL